MLWIAFRCFVFVTDAGEFTWYNESSTLRASFYYRWPLNGEDAARSARGLRSGCYTPLCAPLQPHNRKHWHGMTSFPRKTLRTLNLNITSCVIPGHYPEYVKMLDRIPAEVLRLIVENVRPRRLFEETLKLKIAAQIGTQSDLKSLCGVSKYVAEFATPRLYESITLHANEVLHLNDLKRKIELCSNNNVKFTKNICLAAPLHQYLRKRCSHYDSKMPDYMDDGSEVCPQPNLYFCSPPMNAEYS